MLERSIKPLAKPPTLGFLLLSCSALAAAALDVDGLANEPEWADATIFDGLKLTQPDSGERPDFATTVRWMARPEGLAFFFACDQDPAKYPRRAPRQQRDNAGGSDRVNVMVDFDGNGQAGYNITLTRSDSLEDSTISNENIFNADWDGLWFHAVTERAGGWDAELLIPWSSALMREADGEQRKIGLYVDRVVAHGDLRSARPAIAFFRPQFLSLFEPATVRAYSASLLRWYPYASVRSDLISGDVEVRSGLDVFWKPNSSLQVTAALNPDFGQVEADDLVVNFDAIETFFSDKRPFFTENQGAFVQQSPEEEQLIYTRRVGAQRDDGMGISDIDAAVKLSGSRYGLDYGVFAVRERDPDVVGRSSSALRLSRPGSSFDIGYLGSHTQRPFLDRHATVHAVDTEWRPSERWIWRTVAVGSETSQARETRSGIGGWSTLIYKPSPRFDLQADFTRYDPSLDFNDLGFQQRADYALYELQGAWRKEDFADGFWLRSQSLELDLNVPENSAGRRLIPEHEIAGEFALRDGSRVWAEAGIQQAGVDDLISRGNGALRVSGGGSAYLAFDSARYGFWKWGSQAYFKRDGIKDRQLYFAQSVRFWVGDDFNIRIGAEFSRFEGRLLWRGGNLFGRFSQTSSVEPSISAEWFSGTRHELRAKLQSLNIVGHDAQALRLQANERLVPSTDAVPDFAISNLGFQLRYRYKINPESDLFVVYSRGGDDFSNERVGADDLIEDTLALRDTDQFLVKVRYAF